ncbi:hypothetical protein, transmembrane [Carnobacterium sp. 17-4]|nr:hypothetical protein, transmembrane [Carnobacterium sp. 17-4]
MFAISIAYALFSMFIAYDESEKLLNNSFPTLLVLDNTMGIKAIISIIVFILSFFFPIIMSFFTSLVLKIIFLIFRIELKFNEIFYVIFISFFPYVFYQIIKSFYVMFFNSMFIIDFLNVPFSYFSDNQILNNFSIVGFVSTIIQIIIFRESVESGRWKIAYIIGLVYLVTMLIPN